MKNHSNLCWIRPSQCYHWRPNLPGSCCIRLEQSAGVSTGIAVTASFSQQTEDRAFCPVVHLLRLRASHCTDYHVTSLLFLRVTCPCSDLCHVKVHSFTIIIIIIITDWTQQESKPTRRPNYKATMDASDELPINLSINKSVKTLHTVYQNT